MIGKYFNKSNEVFFSFIAGQVLDAIVVGILTAIAMSIEYFGSNEVMSVILIMTISYSVSGFYDILTKRKLTNGKSALFKGIYENISTK